MCTAGSRRRSIIWATTWAPSGATEEGRLSSTDVSIEDRLAIQDLMGRYCHAIDSGDVEGYVAVFAPDGVFRSSSGFRYEGADGIRKFMAEFKTRPHAPHSQHWLQQVHIRREGER